MKTARQKLGAKTLLENGQVRDPGSNAWVENAVNRVKQQAMTLIYHLELQFRMSFPVTHPLFLVFCACMLVVEPLCAQRWRHTF